MIDEKKELAQIPYFVFEESQVRAHSIIKRLIVALIIITALLFTTNIIWLKAWTSYDYVEGEEIVTLDGGDGITNYTGNDGGITFGQDYSP